MKRIKYLLLLILAIPYSCDNFLDIHPAGEILNDELFSSSEGFEEALYGVYAQLADPVLYGRNLSYFVTDNIGQYFEASNSDTVTFLSQFKYNDQKVKPVLDTIWIAMYRNIANVNNILENLKSYDRTAFEYYDVYEAECLGVRAFMHFELLRLYSENILQNSAAQGIPYREKYSFEVTPFLSAEETYKKIIADLERAEQLFLENGEYMGGADINASGFVRDRYMHMNLYAIEAVLARVYWTKGDLGKAAEYALKVINSGYFKLANKTEIADLVNGVMSQKETVFGLYSERFYETTWKELYRSKDPGSLNVKPAYEEIYQTDREGADYRYEHWFKTYSNYDAEGLRCMKIVDAYRAEGKKVPDDAVRRSGLNLIRLPELYYIVAEYNLSISDKDVARRYFDAVLVSRGLTAFSVQGLDVKLQNINNERHKEYICEGQWFHVLKRYNMDVYESGSDQTYKASPDIFVFPLPRTEIDYRN